MRKLFGAVMVIYAGIATTYGSMHYFRLIDEALTKSHAEQANEMSTLVSWILNPEFLFTAICLAIFIRYFITLAGYTRQKEVFGDDMPLTYAAYQLSNILLILSAWLGVFVPAVILCLIFDWDFDTAKSWLSDLEQFLTSLPKQLDSLPTLIQFSAFTAYFSARIIGGFVSYWWHRLCHTWRPLWLLIHRPHHIPERISEMTSIVADDTGIGFVLKKLALPLVYGVLATLFTHDTITLVEIIMVVTLFELVFHVAIGSLGHTLTMYQWGVSRRWVLWGFFIKSGGPFHLMHHSSHPDHQAVNLGFCPFYIWDILFGTFVWPTKATPTTGLSNNPEVYMNPFRLVFAGFAEMLMEFKTNKDVKDRLLILLGSSQYNPPIRFHFCKKYPLTTSLSKNITVAEASLT